MFSFFYRKLRFAARKTRHAQPDKAGGTCDQQAVLEQKLTGSFSKDLELIRLTLCSSDVIVREFCFGKGHREAAVIFIDGLVKLQMINKTILEPLMYQTGWLDPHIDTDTCDIETVSKTMLAGAQVTCESQLVKLVDECLQGNIILLIDRADRALLINCKGWERRAVDEPSSESVVRGPREGFTESLSTNTALLRRKIKNDALFFEKRILGKQTRTAVCIAYLKGITNERLIQSIRKRLDRIDTDAILESGYIEQYIEDAPLSVFATIGYSEKPDVVAAKLLEGRAAIIVDGTPFVLTAPFLFIESFQTAEDYYIRPYFAAVLRLTRYLAFFITTLSPALYVAVTTFHQELLPTELLFTMVAAREGIPFPAVLEALVMLFAFEILREAGVRLPKPVGQAMSIVGALIMGDAAVSAGLIGAPMVVVIAITAVSTFAVPSQADAAAILRLIYLLLAGFMGGPGILFGVLGTLVHLSSLKSFGIPFFSPYAPLQPQDLKDSLIRVPLWMMFTRPKNMSSQNRVRQQFSAPSFNGFRYEYTDEEAGQS